MKLEVNYEVISLIIWIIISFQLKEAAYCFAWFYAVKDSTVLKTMLFCPMWERIGNFKFKKSVVTSLHKITLNKYFVYFPIALIFTFLICWGCNFTWQRMMHICILLCHVFQVRCLRHGEWPPASLKVCFKTKISKYLNISVQNI